MIFIPTILMPFGVSIHAWMFIISFLIAIGISLFLFPFSNSSSKWLGIFLFIVFISCSLLLLVYICSNLYVSGYDSNSYHKVAVGLLKSGWNPWTGSSHDFVMQNMSVNDYPLTTPAKWIDHYAKGTWIFSSVMYAFFGNVECGKIYNILGVFASFIFVYCASYELSSSKLVSLILGIVTALNPVSIAQLTEYYVDGFLYSIFFVLLCSLTKFALTPKFTTLKENILLWTLIISSMCILANIKITGLLYGGVFCIVTYAYHSYKYFCMQKNINVNVVLKNLLLFTSTAISSICIMGLHTYVRNTLDHGNPCYPIVGADKVDVLTSQIPETLVGHNTIYKLFYSIYGCMQVSISDSVHLRLPFIPTLEEFSMIPGPDLRISGYGLFFSGLFSISMITCVILLIKDIKTSKSLNYYSVLFITSLSLAIFISDGWWARFTPYIYLIVIIALFMILFIFQQHPKYYSTICVILLSLLFLANNIFFFKNTISSVKYSLIVNYQFNPLKGQDILLELDSGVGKLFDFKDHDINYTVVDTIENPSQGCYSEIIEIW